MLFMYLTAMLQDLEYYRKVTDSSAWIRFVIQKLILYILKLKQRYCLTVV